ncbi:MAG: acyl-CoA dehydrogenase family protein, partial [Stellaceae bacterium]
AEAMRDSQDLLRDAIERLFSREVNREVLETAEAGAFPAALWRALEEAGVTLPSVPGALGGAGGNVLDELVVVRAAGRHAAPVPLPETMLAGWLLTQAKISSPEGEMTVAPASPRDRITLNADGTLSGRARVVPFAKAAKHIAVLASDAKGLSIALVDAAKCRIEAGLNVGGDNSDTVTFDKVAPVTTKPAPKGFDHNALLLMGGVARSLQIAGALESLLDISVRYSNERVAFEKKISKFQAVQHNLARLAGESAAALAAATSAADALSNATQFNDETFLEAAAAKIRCSEAAEKGSGIAHQVHGAIGFTSEHILHRYSLRALAWRDDFGSESFWAVELGKLIAARGADELWPLVASR